MSRKKQQNTPLTQTKKSPKILGYSFSKDVSKAAPKALPESPAAG